MEYSKQVAHYDYTHRPIVRALYKQPCLVTTCKLTRKICFHISPSKRRRIGVRSMELLSDEMLAIFVPIVVYWVYSGMYMALGRSMNKYRLHSRIEEDSKNLVSKRDVIKGVLLQHLVQAAVAAVVFTVRTCDNTIHSDVYLAPTHHIHR
jgi:hypothetical protein